MSSLGLVNYEDLDYDQREVLSHIQDEPENLWIKGYAGSGKSLLMAYAIKYAIEELQGDADVLIVAYTRSLVEMYRTMLRQMGLKHIPQVVTMYEYEQGFSWWYDKRADRWKKNELNEEYDYIFCDEIQDMPDEVIEKMKEDSNHLIVAGDEKQSIFNEDVKHNRATVDPDDIESLIEGETMSLGVIYRLPETIVNAVSKLMDDDSLSEAEIRSDVDTQIMIGHSESVSNELNFVWLYAHKLVSRGQSTCILVYDQSAAVDFANKVLELNGCEEWEESRNKFGIDFDSLNNYLNKCDVDIQYVGSNYGSLAEADEKVTLMTMYSAKGLEFESVLIPFSNNRMDLGSDIDLARRLYYVAMTRCHTNLIITYTGRPHEFIKDFYDDDSCYRFNVEDHLPERKRSIRAKR